MMDVRDKRFDNKTQKNENQLSYVIQIFTGGFLQKGISYGAIEEKLAYAIDNLPVNKVIIGWSDDVEIYRKLIDFVHGYDIPIYLWMPVFSEINDVIEGDAYVLHDGEILGASRLNEGEGFTFVCPTSNRNIMNVTKVYEDRYGDMDFDGVFLDRIRYPSFSNGIESIYGCYCERCVERMQRTGIRNDTIYNINKLESIVPYKKAMINRSVIELIDYFKSKRMSVGLDVFAPSLAPYVGQDILTLSKHADFIKPMMYFKTNAPAGLPYEMTLMHEGQLNVGVSSYDGARGVVTVDRQKEYDALEEIFRKASCDIVPGFELNYIGGIAETDEDYIREQLEVYASNDRCKAVVLSWNLLDMPKEHVDAVIKRLPQN